MSRPRWSVLVMTLGFVTLAVSAGWAQEEPKEEQEPCHKICYEELDACSEKCSNRVDDNLCAKECLDKKDKCIEKCD